MGYSMGYSPWVPVRARYNLTASEEAELVDLVPAARTRTRFHASPPQVLRAAHLLADFDFEHPPVESVVRRIFAALTARVTGLDNRKESAWRSTQKRTLTQGIDRDCIDSYFAEHESRMRLFDADRPVLQDPRLAKEVGSVAAPGRLVMNRASGNNPVWEDRTSQDSPIEPSDALGWLLAWRGYGPSGLVGRRSHAGYTSGSSRTGIYRSTVSFFPHGASLLETLVYSVPMPSTWPDGTEADLAPWETDRLPDPLNPEAPTGIISLLTARSAHAVLLVSGSDDMVTGCYVTWNSAPVLPMAIDPYMIYRKTGEFVSADLNRSSWEDIDRLLRPETVRGAETYQRASVFESMADENAPRLGVRVLGWEQEGRDRNRGWYAATTPHVLQLAEAAPETASAAQRVSEEASNIAFLLQRALGNAWTTCNFGRTPKQRAVFTGPAMRAFWAETEKEFWAVLEDPTHTHQLLKTSKKIYWKTAARLGTTPRAMEAVASQARGLTPRQPKQSRKSATSR